MRGWLAISVLLGACAAAPSPAARPTLLAARAASPTSAPRPADPGVLAEQVHLRCADPSCPEGVGMLLSGELGSLQRCTASLVAEDLALTASHCLPVEARRAGASCAGTWLTFPRVAEHPAEWVACRGVVHAGAVDDAEVLRTDVALVRLARRLGREPLAIGLAPLEREVIVSVPAVRPHPIYDLQHELSTRLCRVATAASAVDTFGEGASAVGWLVECPSHQGNSGAPVLDARGRIRALLHGGSAPIQGIGVTSRLEVPVEALVE